MKWFTLDSRLEMLLKLDCFLEMLSKYDFKRKHLFFHHDDIKKKKTVTRRLDFSFTMLSVSVECSSVMAMGWSDLPWTHAWKCCWPCWCIKYFTETLCRIECVIKRPLIALPICLCVPVFQVTKKYHIATQNLVLFLFFYIFYVLFNNASYILLDHLSLSC